MRDASRHAARTSELLASSPVYQELYASQQKGVSEMAEPIGKRPENFWKTLRTLLHYMGNHRFLLLAVAVLVSLSALANLLGTYMLKPIVNDYIIPRDVNGLIHAVALTACIYGAGVLSAYGYTQIMVVVAQKIVCEIREDLFHRMQSLPLRYFRYQS